MAEHELKIWPAPFEAVVDRSKRHEIRRADRPFAVGDVLVLREWEPEREWTGDGHRLMPQTDYNGYTGRWVQVRVTYVTQPGTWGLPADLCVMTIAVDAVCLRGEWR